MKHLVWSLYFNHRRNTSFVLAGLSACMIILALYWGASGLILIPRARLLDSKAKTEMSTIVFQRSSGGAAPRAPNAGDIPTPSLAIEELQQSLVADAQETGCTVTQFTPDATPGAYISVYGVQDSDFGSYHIHTTIKGNLGSVLTCLQKLGDGPVPFEISAMQVDGAGGANGNLGSASLTLQITTKAPPPPPGAS